MPVPQGFVVANPTFLPARRQVTAITRVLNAAVTTLSNHLFETGDIVRLYVPIGWGMIQIDHLVGTVTVTGATTFTIDINSSNFDAFVTPPNPSPTVISVAQVVPVGQINSKLTQSTRNVL